MQSEVQGTLARITGSPIRRKRKVAVTAKQLAEVLLNTVKKDTPELPDSQAVRFYALNQMISGLFQKFTPNERLPDWAQSIAVDYEAELVKQHRLLTWYTFLVITREFRHLKNPAKVFAVKSIGYTQGLKDLLPTIHDTHDEKTLNTWLKNVPEDTLEHYCRCLTHAFDTGSWGGGYGGKPWGMIARALGAYFAGETSAEVFIDTAYTLAHNNGPMFNKGMFYQHYSGQFKAVLDVQRSGQVCEGLLDGQVQGWFQVEGADKLVAQAKDVQRELGGIGDFIDWYKVEALGALGQYSTYKSAQDKKHGKKPVVKLMAGQPIKAKGVFEVFPGQSVEIYERMAA